MSQPSNPRSRRLCDECATKEIRQAVACSDREEAAKRVGQKYACTCPRVVCEHS